MEIVVRAEGPHAARAVTEAVAEAVSREVPLVGVGAPGGVHAADVTMALAQAWRSGVEVLTPESEGVMAALVASGGVRECRSRAGFGEVPPGAVEVVSDEGTETVWSPGEGPSVVVPGVADGGAPTPDRNMEEVLREYLERTGSTDPDAVVAVFQDL